MPAEASLSNFIVTSSLKSFLTAPSLVTLQNSAHNPYTVVIHLFINTPLARPWGPRRQNRVLVPEAQKVFSQCLQRCLSGSKWILGATCQLAPRCLLLNLPGTRGAWISADFANLALHSQFHLCLVLPGVQDCLPAGTLLLCANFTTFGSVTIPRWPPLGQSTHCFPGF